MPLYREYNIGKYEGYRMIRVPMIRCGQRAVVGADIGFVKQLAEIIVGTTEATAPTC